MDGSRSGASLKLAEMRAPVSVDIWTVSSFPSVIKSNQRPAIISEDKFNLPAGLTALKHLVLRYRDVDFSHRVIR